MSNKGMSNRKTVQVSSFDLRVGDKVTFKPGWDISNGFSADETLTGTVVERGGELYAVGNMLKFVSGSWNDNMEFISATRELSVRELPAAPGSVIRWGDQVAYLRLAGNEWAVSGGKVYSRTGLLALVGGDEWEELVPKRRMSVAEVREALCDWGLSEDAYRRIPEAFGVEVIAGEVPRV